MSDIKTLLRYDAREFTREGNSVSAYDNRAITFTSDGYIITHGIAYDATGIAKQLGNITDIANLTGGSAGELVYQTASSSTGFIAAGTAGQILKSNGTSAPSWIDVVTYGLALNAESLNKGVTSSPTYDLGKIYAPTSAGTSGDLLVSNGSGAPIWKSLWTSAITADVTNNVDNLNIPTVNAVNNAIATAVGSYLKWQGNTSTTGSGTSTRAVIPTTTATAVGQAWRVSATGELPAANSVTGQKETLESGDILICITPYDSNNSTKTPVFTIAQTNWTITTPSGGVPTLGTSDTTIATIGGVDIKAKVAADTNTWRPIQVGGTQKLTDTSGGTALNFIANNTGITVSYDSGIKIDLDIAGTSEIGGIKIAKDNTSYAVTALTSNISSAKTANAYTKDLGYFGLEIDSNDKAFVYIPTAVASSTDSSRVFGLVSSSSDVTNTTGYTAAPIINGLIYTPNIATLMGNKKGFTDQGIYWTGSEWATMTCTVKTSVPENAKFTDTNTWRPIYAYTLTKDSTLESRLDNSTTDTHVLQFGSEFAWTEGDTNGASTSEIHLAWAEISSDGTITYAV